MTYWELSVGGKEEKSLGKKTTRNESFRGKIAGQSLSSEHIDREASSTELTLCLVCEVLLLRTFDGQHIRSDTYEEPKKCVCQNKTGANAGSMTEGVLI